MALDLAVNKQNGMSRGLRFLFDRNSSHLAVRVPLLGLNMTALIFTMIRISLRRAIKYH